MQEKVGKGLTALGVAQILFGNVLCCIEISHNILPFLNPLLKRLYEQTVHDPLLFHPDFTGRYKTAQIVEKARK